MKIFRKMIIIDLIVMSLPIIVSIISPVPSIAIYVGMFACVFLFANFYITIRIKREEIKEYCYNLYEDKKIANFYFKWSIVFSYITLIVSIVVAIVFLKLVL
ncbi:hypothetical protein [Inconstantimicrobium mannanitabidum]|uniref:Uncharacterized protein n=1 Tax=Inconstantimicrobium mannanitabidum TaxID=1604901 RepID=A0ACB5RHT7_9CLOT|nr:hypothetical protein [Clostridium sp. TW13]GKX68618.1 hypothetical protein rsdtw13_38760 [Clostridium sp. TW13]